MMPRRPLLGSIGVVAGCVILVTVLLSACGRRSPEPVERHLSVYNWADFIGKTTIADFEKETGIRVDYDTFDADTTLEAKMLSGGSDYDVVSTAQNFFSRQIKAGTYRTLDRTRLTNWKNLDPKSLALLADSDPANAHAVPYLHAINGYAYNVDLIRARMPDAPVDSLDLIFKPEYIKRFADCGVSFLDSAEDVLQLALNYLHLDPNTTRPEDFKKAEDLLMAVRPYIRNFDSSEYMNGLATEEVCIVMSWSSDYAVSMARARAAGLKVSLAFTVPKEGANITFNGLLIPIDAPHPAEAHEFLNFMMRPDVIAKVTNDTRYANENLAANPLVDPAILNDHTIYQSPEIAKRLYVTSEVNAATERIRTRLWTHIKTGR